MEFWATADVKDPELELRVEEWQFFYNWQRPVGALGGRTPIEKVCLLRETVPCSSK